LYYYGSGQQVGGNDPHTIRRAISKDGIHFEGEGAAFRYLGKRSISELHLQRRAALDAGGRDARQRRRGRADNRSVRRPPEGRGLPDGVQDLARL